MRQAHRGPTPSPPPEAGGRKDKKKIKNVKNPDNPKA